MLVELGGSPAVLDDETPLNLVELDCFSVELVSNRLGCEWGLIWLYCRVVGCTAATVGAIVGGTGVVTGLTIVCCVELADGALLTVVEAPTRLAKLPAVSSSSTFTMLASLLGFWLARHARNRVQYCSFNRSRLMHDFGPRLWMAA